MSQAAQPLGVMIAVAVNLLSESLGLAIAMGAEARNDLGSRDLALDLARRARTKRCLPSSSELPGLLAERAKKESNDACWKKNCDQGVLWVFSSEFL